MYNIFMTNTLISTQLGHLDRAEAMCNTGVTHARRSARTWTPSTFFRKKS